MEKVKGKARETHQFEPAASAGKEEKIKGNAKETSYYHFLLLTKKHSVNETERYLALTIFSV